jgi:hypothetical protein
MYLIFGLIKLNYNFFNYKIDDLHKKNCVVMDIYLITVRGIMAISP